MTPFRHARLREIALYLDQVRGDLARIVVSADPTAMHQTPEDGGWSGAQIVQHLGKVEGSTAKLLEGILAAALQGGLPDDVSTGSLMSSLDRFTEDGAVLRPLVAPERLRPEAMPDLAASWASLLSVRERTYRAFATVDGKDLTRLSAPHPLFGPLNAYEWLLFVGKHEERHLGQLRRTLAR